MGYTFEWKRENGYINIPVRIGKTADSKFFGNSKLICNECELPVNQIYKCDNCGKEYKLGEIKKRYDAEFDVIYTIDEKKSFMETNIETIIKVEGEISFDDLLMNIYFVLDFYEIYNNDIDIIKKIHNYLFKKKIALLVTFGYRGEQRGGVIIPAKDRLLLLELRDYKLIRERKQDDIEPISVENDEKIKAVSERKTKDTYLKFVEKKQKGEKIEIKEKKEEKKKIVVECDFLD